MTLLDDIDKDTVDFAPNYDGSRERAAGPARALPQPAGQRRRRHRGRHGDQHPAAQSRRSHRRLPRLYRQWRDHRRRADGDRPRPRFPDRRASSSASAGARAAYHDRPRLDHRALAPRRRGRARRPPLDRAHRNPLPDRQERPGREDRRGRQGQADRGRQRHPRRIEPRGRAHRHRPEARRDARGGAQPALAAHAGASRASRPTCSPSAAAGPKR